MSSSRSAPSRIGDRPGQILSIRDVATRKQTEETLARLVADLQSMLPLATRSIKSMPLTLVTCGLDTPIHKAVATMARAKSSAILVTGPGGEPIGMVTDQDLRNRVLALARDAAQPVSTIMSAPLVRIADHALLFEAALLMQEHGIQHLVVTDERGATLGVLIGTEILHAQRHAIAALLGEIQEARSPEELKDSRAKLPVFVKALLESGARVESVTRIMTTVSDAILVRLIELAEADLGPPPVAFAFVVLGSEAREEQTLATDQDNAIIFADGDPERTAAAQAYFLRLGDKVCGWLDLVGYRRCKGDVMASNPKWCQPLSAWRRYFTECVAAARPQDLLDVNVFFDFRCAYGQADYVRAAASAPARRPGRRRQTRLLLPPGPEHPAIQAAPRLLRQHPAGIVRRTLRRLQHQDRHHPAGELCTDVCPAAPPGGDEHPRAAAAPAGPGRAAAIQPRRAGPGLHHPDADAADAPGGPDRTTALVPDNAIDLQTLTQLERSVLKKVFADITVFQARLETDFARTV